MSEDASGGSWEVPGTAAPEGAPDAQGAAPRAEEATEGRGREAERRAIVEHNALAAVFEAVSVASADGVLSTPAQWAAQGLVPGHMSPEDLDLMAWYDAHGRPDEGGSFLASDLLAPAQPAEPEGPSPFASRGVGVPPAIGGVPVEAQPDEGAAGARAGQPDEAPSSSEPALPDGYELVELEGELALVATGASEGALGEADEGDDPFAGLRVPEGYHLVELDGEVVLLQTDPDALPQRQAIHCEDIALLMGAFGYYLYDTSRMTGSYARWAFLAAEDDPLVTFVYCVREESRVYPRPMAITSFANEPFGLEAPVVEGLFDQARACSDYADIRRTEASNGEVYFYSTDYLEPAQADALAEWHSVERLLNL